MVVCPIDPLRILPTFLSWSCIQSGIPLTHNENGIWPGGIPDCVKKLKYRQGDVGQSGENCVHCAKVGLGEMLGTVQLCNGTSPQCNLRGPPAGPLCQNVEVERLLEPWSAANFAAVFKQMPLADGLRLH